MWSFKIVNTIKFCFRFARLKEQNHITIAIKKVSSKTYAVYNVVKIFQLTMGLSNLVIYVTYDLIHPFLSFQAICVLPSEPHINSLTFQEQPSFTLRSHPSESPGYM